MKKENKTLGICRICKRDITEVMLKSGKAIYLGQNLYRCRRKKCEDKVITEAKKSLNI